MIETGDLTGLMQGAEELTRVYSRHWDMGEIEILDHTFANCINLEYIDASLWNTEALYDMRGVFANCSSLTSINCKNWKTKKVVDFSQAFSGCKSLEIIDLSNWDFSNASDMEDMFRGCTNLKKVIIKNWNIKSGNAKGLFYNCPNLEELDLTGFDHFHLNSPSPNYEEVFHKCVSLKTLVGGRQSLSETIFKNANSNICLGHSSLLDRYSIRAIFNGVPQRRVPFYDNMYGRIGIYLHYETRKQVSDEDIAIATEKGWDVNFVEPLGYEKKESYQGNIKKLES